MHDCKHGPRRPDHIFKQIQQNVGRLTVQLPIGVCESILVKNFRDVMESIVQLNEGDVEGMLISLTDLSNDTAIRSVVEDYIYHKVCEDLEGLQICGMKMAPGEEMSIEAPVEVQHYIQTGGEYVGCIYEGTGVWDDTFIEVIDPFNPKDKVEIPRNQLDEIEEQEFKELFDLIQKSVESDRDNRIKDMVIELMLDRAHYKKVE